jgi:4-amino-4-deoxy-L-arabinose transferase-like glycosyltransferase
MPSSEPAGRRRDLLLLLIPALAVLVRLPGVWQNLPFVFHWDEPTLVNLATWLFTEGSLNPRYFNYPGGMIYLLGLLYALVLAGGTLFGTFPGWSAAIHALAEGTYPRPPGGGILYRFPTRGAPVAYVVGRLASVVLGALSAWWVARTADRIGGRRAAWLAGGFLALNALHAANSAILTTDVACGAFLAWFACALVEGRSPRTAGLALGLAAAFKYTGGIGLYLWPLGLLLPGEDAGADRRAWNRYWIRLLPWAAGAFVALNPFAVLTPGAFLRGFLYEAGHMRAGTEHFGEGIAMGPIGPAVVAETLGRDLGPVALLAIVLAVVLAWRTRRTSGRWIVLLAAWCALYLLQLCTWKTAYPRYLLPLWPALAVLAGCGAAMAAEFVEARRHRVAVPAATGAAAPSTPPAPSTGPATTAANHASVVLAACALLLLAPGLVRLVPSVAARMRPDPRVAMAAFAASSLEPGPGIGVEPGGPWLSGEHNQVIRADLLGRFSPEGWRRQGVRYLLATGRESYLPTGSPESLQVNRAQIDAGTKVLWRQGPYAVLDLGQGGEDEIRALIAKGQAREAEARARALCAEDPSSVSAQMLLGDVLLARQDTSSAVDVYARAADLAPADPTPLLALGNLALGGRAWDAAIAAFESAAERAPRDPVAFQDLATAHLYRAKSLAEANRRSEVAEDVRAALGFARMAISLDPADERFRQTEASARELARRYGISIDPGR